MRAALLLVLALLLPGCFTGETDLTLVCERKSTSPWHPYPLDFVASRTTVEGNATMLPEDRDRILAPVPDLLLTPGGRPYRDFRANLTPIGPEAWLFAATGTWTQGEVNGTDQYFFVLPPLEQGARLDAPAWVTHLARLVVNDSPDVGELRVNELSLHATWTEELPSCVRMEYREEAPEQGEGPAVATVHVNLHQGRVVHVVRPEA